MGNPPLRFFKGVNVLKKLLCVWLVLAAGAAHAFTPQAGTWVVTSEVDGRPGRGIALDVQNRTLVMQMYAYERSGQPTFYLGVGNWTGAGVVSMGLKRYTGGRYFGSGPRTGVEDSLLGTARLRFTSGTTGFVTFPGETEVAISRFNFGYERVPASLRGTWGFLSWGTTGSVLGEVDELTVMRPPSANGNGAVVTADGKFGCEHQTSGAYADTVLCVRVDGRGMFLRTYQFVYSMNDADGQQIGADGALSGQLVSIKHIAHASGLGVGIALSAEAEPTPALFPRCRCVRRRSRP